MSVEAQVENRVTMLLLEAPDNQFPGIRPKEFLYGGPDKNVSDPHQAFFSI